MKIILRILLTILSLLIKMLLALTVMIVLVPLAYFAWRAVRPMDMPEFHGLIYYQLLAERRQAYDQLARTFQANHPNMNMKIGICYSSELIMIAYNLPWAGYCTMSGFIPGLRIPIGSNARRLGCGKKEGAQPNVLENWWDMYERFTYDLMGHIVVGAVPYCRIPPP